mmetsp:Transcript_7265/g.16583  ORF Transcript_7265/g.16583 Transcript_7265/m.16583 type:complete len:269 (-) Transcript_7265:1785-2591(-)
MPLMGTCAAALATVLFWMLSKPSARALPLSPIANPTTQKRSHPSRLTLRATCQRLCLLRDPRVAGTSQLTSRVSSNCARHSLMPSSSSVTLSSRSSASSAVQLGPTSCRWLTSRSCWRSRRPKRASELERPLRSARCRLISSTSSLHCQPPRHESSPLFCSSCVGSLAHRFATSRRLVATLSLRALSVTSTLCSLLRGQSSDSLLPMALNATFLLGSFSCLIARRPCSQTKSYTQSWCRSPPSTSTCSPTSSLAAARTTLPSSLRAST